MSDLTWSLVLAGTGTDDHIAALVEDAGLDPVVHALAEEIAFRCPEPTNTTAVSVALDIVHRDAVRRLSLRVRRDEPVRWSIGPAADDGEPVHVRLGIEVTDLVRRLYGRSVRRVEEDFRSSFLPTIPSDLGQVPDLVGAAARAADTVLAGCSADPPRLGDLSVRYGSDKWASFHWYTPHYERHFARLRDEPVRILEIGIGGYGDDPGGASLKMWKRYFHRGLIYGLDVFDKSELTEPRLTALVGDQSDPGGLAALAEEHGPFDVIIDDGSHVNEHVHVSFRALFPHLRHGGLYVIEDLQTSYAPSFGGSRGRTAEPHTSIGLVKHLLDEMHHQEWQCEDCDSSGQGLECLVRRTLVGVHIHHNIVFVEKGTNGEEGLPPWMNQDAWDAAHGDP